MFNKPEDLIDASKRQGRAIYYAIGADVREAERKAADAQYKAEMARANVNLVFAVICLIALVVLIAITLLSR